MGLSESDILAISYFSVQFVFTLILSVIVFIKGGHHSAKSFIKDLWQQRSIYGSVLVQFYDTATDLGVMVNWYFLMRAEQNGEYDYVSINMTAFFWCNISSMLLYRVIVFVGAVYVVIDSKNEKDIELRQPWWIIILTLTETYILYAVYESFEYNKEELKENAAKRKMKAQHEKAIEMAQKTIEMTQKTEDNELNRKTEIKQERTDRTELEQDIVMEPIEPSNQQKGVLFLEAICEALPQILIQTVFFIKSANDEELSKAGSNEPLIVFSILASLFSIGNKMSLFMDASESVAEEAKSLNPRKEFPKCINYWKLAMLFWRLCDIMGRVIIFALIWAVLGGVIFIIYASSVCCSWCCIWCISNIINEQDTDYHAGINCLLAGIIRPDAPISHHIFKYIENCIGLIIVTIYASSTKYTCSMCEDQENRQWNNQRIFIFGLLAWTALFCECLIFAILRSNKIVQFLHIGDDDDGDDDGDDDEQN